LLAAIFSVTIIILFISILIKFRFNEDISIYILSSAGPENVCKEQIFELISKMLTHLNDVDQRNSSESLKISHKVAKNYGDLNKADDVSTF
jgi:hypothetical protein